MADESGKQNDQGVGSIIWAGLRRRGLRHRVSLFLLIAMVVVLLLGVQFVEIQDDPKRLAWFLTLYFVFFLIVIGRAIFEMLDIVREHVRERESVFRKAFHEGDFPEELGRRVSKADAGSWPE